MQLFMCCLLIPSLATIVVTAPVRAQRDNVLSFITDALEKARTTERIPADITGNRHPPSKPVAEDDSEVANSFSDMSDAKSAEDTNGFKDAARDLDSHEITIPVVVEKDKAPPRRNTAAVDMGLMDTSRSVVQDSDEEMMLGPHGVERLPGRQISHLPGGQKTDSPSGGVGLQRKVGKGGELNGGLAYGGSRELQDGDSLEDNNGRLTPRGNRDTDYDETREDNSSDTYPPVRPEHKPSSLFVPATSQTT